MKKIMSIIFILFLTGCGRELNTDGIKFKEEYESLNNQSNSNSQQYLEMNIDEDNAIKYATYEETIEAIKNETAIIYFGFPEYPWCRNAVPVLLDAAKELGIDKIYYYNALSIRDKKSLDENGNIITDEEGTKEYKQLVEMLYNNLPVYSGLNDNTIKRLYFPTVVFIKDGKVLGLHTSTVESQTNPYVKLTDEQYNELKQIYSNYINETFDIVCDEGC